MIVTFEKQKQALLDSLHHDEFNILNEVNFHHIELSKVLDFMENSKLGYSTFLFFILIFLLLKRVLEISQINRLVNVVFHDEFSGKS